MRKFLVVSHARSGSNLLVRSLDAHPKVVSRGELLKRTEPLDPLRALDFSAERIADLERTRVSRSREFGDTFWSGFSGVSAAGFKLFYYHGRHLGPTIWTEIADNSDISIIHLYRESHFDAFLSLKLAEASGVWVRPAGKFQETDYGRSVTVDLDEFEKYSDELSAHIEGMNALVPKDRIRQVTYSRLVSSYGEELNGCFDFLGVGRISVEMPLDRQRGGTAMDYVANRNEVERYLADRDLLLETEDI
ncbi:hypothetical protein [Paraoerskovia marina]|uniref:hypothetical protein n=1 Tax=Paraoerskovia marina TaxID=545619 RepID=UPI0012DEF999|nr:hypothetical protein [Paraoerskovia marina]